MRVNVCVSICLSVFGVCVGLAIGRATPAPCTGRYLPPLQQAVAPSPQALAPRPPLDLRCTENTRQSVEEQPQMSGMQAPPKYHLPGARHNGHTEIVIDWRRSWCCWEVPYGTV